MTTVARQLGALLTVLILASALTFFVMELLPGDAATTLLGENATQEDLQALRNDLGLNRASALRYGEWLWDAIHLDLGRSPFTGEAVANQVGARLAVSVELVMLAQVAALLIAIPLALWCGFHRGGAADRVASAISLALLSLPSYVLAILLVFVFAVSLRWLPAAGYETLAHDPVAHFRAMVLPVLSLALAELPAYFRFLRQELSGVLRENFVRTAVAKGLPGRAILFGHCLRPSLITLITAVGIHFGHLLSSAVIIETLFALPGLGRLLIDSVFARDTLTVQGVVLVLAGIFVLVNFVVDQLYGVLDPRLRQPVSTQP